MRRSTLATTTVFVLMLQATAATAERPGSREHIRFADEVHLVDDFTDACGFDVFHQEKVNVVIRGFEDRVEVNVSGRTEFTTATGDPGVTNRFSHHHTITEAVSQDDDTQTIVSERTFRGLPSLWMQEGEGVFLRDAGVAHFTVTVTLDTSGPAPELLDATVDVHEVHGPHPELEMSDEDFFATVCAALA